MVLSTLVFSACQDPVATDSCGDGFVDPGEECDSSTGGATCQSMGYYDVQGSLSCTSKCVFDDSSCGGRCGDNTVNVDHGEECDGVNLNGSSCQALGSTGGVLRCDASCRFDVSGCTSFCGNGVVENDESCDDGNANLGDGCAQCQIEAGWTCAGQPSLCEPECGDGLIRGDEVCDGEVLDGNTCELQGFYGGTLACGEECGSFDESGCSGRCGDGTLDAGFGEVCDTAAPVGSPSCGSLGYCGGTVECGADCQGADYGTCTGWAQISVGGTHTCAVAQDGSLWCWGNNAYGQLGDGTTTVRHLPTRVSGMTDVAQVSAGKFHSCAIKNGGSAWCWGYNASGQLGDNGTHQTCNVYDCSPTPVAVSGLGAGVVSIGVGRDHSCVLKVDGSVWCWGANDNRQLGDGTMTNRSTPVLVSGLGQGVHLLSVGLRHNCMVSIGGSAWCWGRNDSGQLGDGTVNSSSVPVEVSNLGQQVSGVSAGGLHSCAVKNDGSAWCWGGNGSGQLGDGTADFKLVPVAVLDLGSGVAQISAGSVESMYESTCAVKNDGSAWCWGANRFSQLGLGTINESRRPLQVTALGTEVGAIIMGGSISTSNGEAHACALKTDGSAWCWGFNNYGNLGDGTTTNRSTPVTVSGQL